MAGRGVLFALTEDQVNRLLSANTEEKLMSFIEETEEAWNEDELVETDKAWDAIHRCLSGGALEFEGGPYPLSRCIIGGRQLYEGDDYIIAFINGNEVRDVAAALEGIDKEELRKRYFDLKSTDYPQEYLTEEDFEYTWAWFEGVKGFYNQAAKNNRAALFTVDQ